MELVDPPPPPPPPPPHTHTHTHKNTPTPPDALGVVFSGMEGTLQLRSDRKCCVVF